MSRIAVALAQLAAVAVLSGVLAHWGWRWFGPAPLPAERRPIDDVAAALAVSPPFGSAPAAPEAAPVAAAAGGIRLLGVLAEPGGRGRALLRLPDGTAKLAAAGDELGASGTLLAVHADAVTLRDGAGERRLPLGSAPAEPKAAPPSSARKAACVPPGYRGAIVRLNAELVSGLIQQPQSLRAVAEAQDGALVVRDESGFAAMLGLRKGDRIVQANGIALRVPEDVVIAVLRPLAANQAVRMSGTRGGTPQELLIVNAASCS